MLSCSVYIVIVTVPRDSITHNAFRPKKAGAGISTFFFAILPTQTQSSFVIGTLPCKGVKGRALHPRPPHFRGKLSAYPHS